MRKRSVSKHFVRKHSVKNRFVRKCFVIFVEQLKQSLLMSSFCYENAALWSGRFYSISLGNLTSKRHKKRLKMDNLSVISTVPSTSLSDQV